MIFSELQNLIDTESTTGNNNNKMTMFENNSNWSLNSPMDQFTLNDLFYDKEFDFFGLDPTELFNDLEQIPLRSIHLDCKQIESSSSANASLSSIASTTELPILSTTTAVSSVTSGGCDGILSLTTEMNNESTDILDVDLSKYEIRNHDCMWSGLCVNSTTNKKQQRKQQQQQKIDSSNNNNNKNNMIKNNLLTNIQIKKEIDEIEEQTTTQQQPQPQSTQQVTRIQNNLRQQQQNIVPPGTSLLLNSRIVQKRKQMQQQHQQQQQQQQQNITNFIIPSMSAVDFLKDREVLSIVRPDTPLSLDDDPPEFKHTLDLAACVMGSNNISLDGYTDKMIINKLKEQLEDETTNRIDIRQIIPGGNKNRSLSEVMNVIENENTTPVTGVIPKIEPEDSDTTSDDEEDEDHGVEDEDDSDLDEDDVEKLIATNKIISTISNNGKNNKNLKNNVGKYSGSSSSSGISSGSSSGSETTSDTSIVHHYDHCYTRSNTAAMIDVVGVGLETPSDSDEEIDVVSIGDKKLPNNPSDNDRRVLQTKVANKISARIVKTANGIRTIPPRRRCSYEPYTAPVTPIKGNSGNFNTLSAINSRYPTPVTTPGSYSSSYHSNVTKNSKYATLTGTATVAASGTISNSSRKRSANDQHHATSNKRHRSKKHKQANRRHLPLDEAETIEKRNLHNDMERQRRIGLRNLFEALKKHIPSIKDKERAPKVNILREAAKYCEQITREEKILMQQKHQLQLLHQRRIAQLQILHMSNEIHVKEENIDD